MGNFFNKGHNWVKYRGLFVIILIITFSLISGGKVFAGPQLHCSFSPSTVPLGGTVSIQCTADSGYTFFQCPFGERVTKIVLDFHYNSSTGPIYFSQSSDCNSATCSVNISASFNQAGRWYFDGCLNRHCPFPADDDTYCTGYWGPIQVLPPVCGDGIINQPNEECDDGNTISGDGCDSTCHLEGVPPTPTPILATGYDNPLRWNTVLEFLDYILRILFYFSIIFLTFILLIGTYYIISGGGSSLRVLLGKKIILWALVGFVIIIMGRVIIWFIRNL
ncbi:DUF4215 domain-containing protein [bacterium]|nr:DUF4215 domain-containing protein [bacterium]